MENTCLGTAHVDDGQLVEFCQRDARLDEELGGSGDVGELPLPLPSAGDGLRVALHPVWGRIFSAFRIFGLLDTYYTHYDV